MEAKYNPEEVALVEKHDAKTLHKGVRYLEHKESAVQVFTTIEGLYRINDRKPFRQLDEESEYLYSGDLIRKPYIIITLKSGARIIRYYDRYLDACHSFEKFENLTEY